MKLELRLEDTPPDALRPGGVNKLEPVIGESGEVAAYRVIGGDGATITTVPASAVKAER
jgi:hypothetical protein